jgi:hypothetical protein
VDIVDEDDVGGDFSRWYSEFKVVGVKTGVEIADAGRFGHVGTWDGFQ